MPRDSATIAMHNAHYTPAFEVSAHTSIGLSLRHLFDSGGVP